MPAECRSDGLWLLREGWFEVWRPRPPGTLPATRSFAMARPRICVARTRRPKPRVARAHTRMRRPQRRLIRAARLSACPSRTRRGGRDGGCRQGRRATHAHDGHGRGGRMRFQSGTMHGNDANARPGGARFALPCRAQAEAVRRERSRGGRWPLCSSPVRRAANLSHSCALFFLRVLSSACCGRRAEGGQASREAVRRLSWRKVKPLKLLH